MGNGFFISQNKDKQFHDFFNWRRLRFLGKGKIYKPAKCCTAF